ncbi:OmpA family protein [bacterium]|nr:OmpA family protein [bacterium]
MKRMIACGVLAVCVVAGCTSMQRGGLIGALIGAGAGAGIGAAGGGVGVAIGAGAGAGAGALMGAVAGEVYEVHRTRLKQEYARFDPDSGEAIVRTKNLADYEKRLTLVEARNRELIARNERLIAESYTLADAIGADGRYLRVESTPEGVMQVSMISEVLFEPGSAKLKEAIYPVLDEIGRTIREDYPQYAVAIEGHTDAIEAADTGYRSQWELSAARSLSVLHYFADQNLIDPARMAVASYGPYRPAGDGSTPEGQRLNRRVVITLVPEGPGGMPMPATPPPPPPPPEPAGTGMGS